MEHNMTIQQALKTARAETAFKIGQSKLYPLGTYMPQEWDGPDPENFYTITLMYSQFCKNPDEAYKQILQNLIETFPNYGTYEDIKTELN